MSIYNFFYKLLNLIQKQKLFLRFDANSQTTILDRIQIFNVLDLSLACIEIMICLISKRSMSACIAIYSLNVLKKQNSQGYRLVIRNILIEPKEYTKSSLLIYQAATFELKQLLLSSARKSAHNSRIGLSGQLVEFQNKKF